MVITDGNLFISMKDGRVYSNMKAGGISMVIMDGKKLT